mmetsp:Transcript_20353/g.50627  ORF Transcript_20353/g.50627 Transcript_20353/m.50627 type:complete len:219 (+) Transcript_20353:232-888(+)
MYMHPVLWVLLLSPVLPVCRPCACAVFVRICVPAARCRGEVGVYPGRVIVVVFSVGRHHLRRQGSGPPLCRQLCSPRCAHHRRAMLEVEQVGPGATRAGRFMSSMAQFNPIRDERVGVRRRRVVVGPLCRGHPSLARAVVVHHGGVSGADGAGVSVAVTARVAVAAAVAQCVAAIDVVAVSFAAVAAVATVAETVAASAVDAVAGCEGGSAAEAIRLG